MLELFRAILKHIKLIIVLCILFGVCGFFGTKLLIAPTYTASTSIYLTPQISESGSLDYNSQMANSKLVTNVVNLLTQNNIMSEVAKDVGLESAECVKKLGFSYHLRQESKYDLTVEHNPYQPNDQ